MAIMPNTFTEYEQRDTVKIPSLKPRWVHKTGRFVRALYACGRGPHYADIMTENSSRTAR